MKRLPIFFVLILGTVFLRAQTPLSPAGSEITKNSFIKHFGTREGLTQPGVTAVLTDSDGAVWIGTRYRLNKYVNGNLEAYDYDKLGGSYINLLYEDGGKDVWVATESGLLQYDKHADSFSPVYAGRILCAAEAGDDIYFAGRGDIVVYNREEKTFSTLPNEAEAIVDAFAPDRNVIIFADNRRGLFSLHTGTGNLGRFPVAELEGKRILCAACSDGVIWVGTFLDGLYKISRDGRVLAHFPARDYPSLSLEVICDICTLDGRICLATDGSGICTVEGDRIVPLKDIPGYAGFSTLPPALTRIYQDAYANIWAGSVKDGLYGIRQTDIHRIDAFKEQPGEAPGSDVILSLCQDGRELWIGTDSGVIRYDPARGTLRRVSSTRGNIISSLCPFGPDRILTSVYCKGLYILDKTRGTRTRLFLADETVDRKELEAGYVQRLYPLSDTEILIAGQNLYGYDLGTGRFSPYSVDYGVEPSDLHPFRQESSPERLYAHSLSKLYRIDPVRQRISFLFQPEGCGRINTAAMSGGRIYFGTDTGLFSYDETDGTTAKLYPEVLTRVTQILERNDSTLWIVNDNTLYSYDRKNSKVEFFDEADGFITNEVNTGVRLGGTFYFGGNYELSAVPGDIRKRGVSQPALQLSRVLADGSVVTPHGGSLRVSPKTRSVVLEFRLKRGNPFGRTLLRYSLDDDAGKALRTYDNTFALDALPSGKHTVCASVFQADGSWSAPEEYLTLVVPEVIWHKKWFLVLLVLSLIAGSLLVIQKALSRANAEAQSVIQENREEDERRRSRFIKSVETELQRPLTQVLKSLQALLADSATPEKTKAGLERAYTKSLQMEKILGDAVEQEQLATPENPFLEKFKRLVEENLNNNRLNVSFLTEEMAMSRSILYDRIKSQTGMGINEYIQKSRLQKARKDLIETDKSIAEISDDLGFSTPKYFSVLFKSAYGVTPKEFRRQLAS